MGYKNQFQEPLNKRASYWFGFLAGDGNINYYGNGRYRISLTLKREDRYHLNNLRQFLGLDHINIYDRKDQPASHLNIDNKSLFQDLRNLGLQSNKPRTITGDLIPRSQKFHFLRGIFDADGSISKYHNANAEYDKCKLIIYGTESLLEITKEIFNSGGSISNYKTCYGLGYSGRLQISEIYDKLYTDANIFLIRKFKTFYKIVKTLETRPAMHSNNRG